MGQSGAKLQILSDTHSFVDFEEPLIITIEMYLMSPRSHKQCFGFSQHTQRWKHSKIPKGSKIPMDRSDPNRVYLVDYICIHPDKIYLTVNGRTKTVWRCSMMVLITATMTQVVSYLWIIFLKKRDFQLVLTFSQSMLGRSAHFIRKNFCTEWGSSCHAYTTLLSNP
jgi:hypothetical protein